MTRRVALTIAGTDSGGGAGVTADLKTFQAHGVWGACAVTAVTVQDTVAVHDVHAVPADVVAAQITTVARDLGVDAAKTGMLGSADVVHAVAAAWREAGLAGRPLVVDPVLAASSGRVLMEAGALDALVEGLLPLATVVTPNMAEAAALLLALGDSDVGDVRDRNDMAAAAAALLATGVGAVLVTGGHLAGSRGSPDCLWAAGEKEPRWLEGDRIDAPNLHGSGCVLSAAITARLALGVGVVEAAIGGKAFTAAAIAQGVSLGRGVGPVDPGLRTPVE